MALVSGRGLVEPTQSLSKSKKYTGEISANKALLVIFVAAPPLVVSLTSIPSE